MNLIEGAYKGLFPNKIFSYLPLVKYSGKFKGYNANIKLERNMLTVSMSKNWKSIGKEIKMGLIQGLMLRIFKKKGNTLEIDLYNIFMKKVHLTIPKTKTSPLLEASFLRVNERFFSGIIDIPNLDWANSIRKVGCYDFGTDTITISKILQEDLDLLDYVMYHELLHKKLKFESKNGKTRSHTKQFREREKLFPNQQLLEKRLSRVCRKNKLKRMFFLS